MKSVCFVVQHPYDSDIRVRRKAEALVAAGYSVDAISLRAPGSNEKEYTLNGVRVYTISLGKLRGSLGRYAFEYLSFLVLSFLKLSRLMRMRRYAVVDVNTLPDFLVFAACYARWKGAKVVLDMHEITPEFFMSKYGVGRGHWLVKLSTFLERISFNYADHVITINGPIQELLESRGLAAAKSTIIMNSADNLMFGVGAAPERDSGKFVMMYHGTLTNIYGLDIALEALAKARREMPNAELWILGDGPEKEALAEQARRLGVEGGVRLVGRVTPQEIPKWLQQCDIGVLATRRDVFLDYSFSNKLSEYIIMGKAVISSRLRTIRHYFSEEALAYFEPNDSASLAAQMVRLFWDRELQSRLATRAKEEYEPIAWPIMRGRYISLLARLTGTGVEMTAVDAKARADKELPDESVSHMGARQVTIELLRYCRTNDWAGYDPYDALNSEVFKALPILDSRLPRLALTQLLKRSPVNLRGLLRVPPTQNAKGLAIFLQAFLKLARLKLLEDPSLIDEMVAKTMASRSPGFPYYAWGYSFPWQTRTLLVPRAAPNLVCTTFVASALLDAYDENGAKGCLEAAAGAADYMVNELFWTEGDVASFNYPMKTSRSRVHNANFLAAAFLCRVARLTGNKKYLGPAYAAARYSAKQQAPDGSWRYGESKKQGWIDNFHTGYNLSGLRMLGKYAGTDEFEDNVRRGFHFYREHFFRPDGAPKYFHNQVYPIDVHSVAQSIITLVEFKDLHEGSVALARRVCDWTVANMRDPAGYFYYRVLPFCTIKTPYMRWGEAWMLLSLSTFLEAELSPLATVSTT